MNDVIETTAEQPVEDVFEQVSNPYFGIEFGQRYIELGQVLQNPNSSVSEVADKANKCGLALVLSIVQNKA